MDYVSIDVIADRIKRNSLLSDIPYETILDYAIEFIKIMGIPNSFIEKTALVEINDYRGVLPCDFYSPIQVRTTKGTYFRHSNDTFHMSPLGHRDSRNDITVKRIDNHPDDGNTYINVGISWEIDDNRNYNNLKGNKGFTYKIQGSCIFTSIPDGTIEIAYKAFPMNSEGMPLIPDNGSYSRALQEYIVVECYVNLFDEGKISGQALANRQSRYNYFAGQARVDLIMPTIDQMESITNMWTRLLPSKRDHQNGYATLGAKEFLKIH